MITKHYKEVKKILKKSNPLDTYFVSKYSFSPYMACQHGCKYCDGRAEKYFVEGDFEKDIVVRRNTAELLDEELSKERDRGVILIGSGISDAYQPCELEEQIMTKVLKVLIKHQYPLLIITKSAHILRDLDLLVQLNEIAGVTVISSLTFPDDVNRKLIEPHASSIEQRIHSLQELKKHGISIGITAMPILPLIVDNEVDLIRLFDLYASLQPSFILSGVLTLRPGRNKDIFMQLLQQKYPQHVQTYQKIYGRNFISGSPLQEYSGPLKERIANLLVERNLSSTVPYEIYKDRFPIYDTIYIYLKHLKYQYRNYQEVDRLLHSFNKYQEWYDIYKTKLAKSRKLTYLDLEDEFYFLFESGVIEQVINNDVLYANIEEKIKISKKEI